jgi:hypothetical protein
LTTGLSRLALTAVDAADEILFVGTERHLAGHEA